MLETAFYDYPAEHWVHLRTTNPIESTFVNGKLAGRRGRPASGRLKFTAARR